MRGNSRSTAALAMLARTAPLLLAALWPGIPPPAAGLEPPIFSASGEGGIFIRGDADQNGALDISDAVSTLGYLFLRSGEPYCLDALDADDDGDLNLTDAVKVLSFLFLGQGTIPAPYPAPGSDPTVDGLDCDNGTFAHLRREIFAQTCASVSCHSSLSAKGNLVLEGRRAYSSLIGVKPDNASALASGMVLVRPGKPAESFLFRKLNGPLGANDGDPMPEVGVQLSYEKLEMVRDWIARGALPSTTADIQLPAPSRGEQLNVPPFPVPVGKEVQRNYYFKLKNEQDMWVDRIEFLNPPGSPHLYLFDGEPSPFPDGYFEEGFLVVPFTDWTLRASSQAGRLDWRLPRGTAIRFKAHDQLLAQTHFVNVGAQTSPIGACATINLHALEPGAAPLPMGSMLIQNRNIVIPRQVGEISFDYGISFSYYRHNVAVKIAAIAGHFHLRGKRFEIRKWDGANRNLNGTPATGEFDRMGPENTIYLSEDWAEPSFELFSEADAPELPPGWGVVYRSTFVNNVDSRFCFGTRVANQEHANVFMYFYPGLPDQDFIWFPPDCTGQGCTVPCQ